MPVPKSLDRCKINVRQSLEIRPLCLKYLRKIKIHGEHSQKISPVCLTANSWGTIPKNRSCVSSNLKQLNILWLPQHLLPQSIRSHTCCNSGSLYVLLFISAAIQDCLLLCYSYRLPHRISPCSVTTISSIILALVR